MLPKRKVNFFMKIYRAFSLVELLVTLMIVSLVVAAFVPVLTRKMSDRVLVTSSKKEDSKGDLVTDCEDRYGPDCRLCYENGQCVTCSLDCGEQYRDDSLCRCTTCADSIENCLECEGVKCVRCEDGMLLTGDREKPCVECPPGKVCDGTSETEPCPAGYWCPGGNVQNKCPVGSTSAPGAESQDDCVSCRPGYYYSAEVKQCVVCEAEHYCNNSVMLPCEKGYFSYEGASSCISCLKRNDAAFEGCVECTKDKCTKCSSEHVYELENGVCKQKCSSYPGTFYVHGVNWTGSQYYPHDGYCIYTRNSGDGGPSIPSSVSVQSYSTICASSLQCCWTGYVATLCNNNAAKAICRSHTIKSITGEDIQLKLMPPLYNASSSALSSLGILDSKKYPQTEHLTSSPVPYCPNSISYLGSQKKYWGSCFPGGYWLENSVFWGTGAHGGISAFVGLSVRCAIY